MRKYIGNGIYSDDKILPASLGLTCDCGNPAIVQRETICDEDPINLCGACVVAANDMKNLHPEG
jgi:hypothetical protein